MKATIHVTILDRHDLHAGTEQSFDIAIGDLIVLLRAVNRADLAGEIPSLCEALARGDLSDATLLYYDNGDDSGEIVLSIPA